MADAIIHAKGANILVGTVAFDPASINAGAESEQDITLTGVEVGDSVFLNPRNLTAKLIVKGARITEADKVKVFLVNLDGSNAVNGGSVTYDYIIIKPGQ